MVIPMSYQYILITKRHTKRGKAMFMVQGKPNPLGGGMYGNFSTLAKAITRAKQLARKYNCSVIGE